MLKQINAVQSFHAAFNLPINKQNRELRIALIKEEAKEVIEALEEGDLEHIAKEFSDLLYVVFGGIVEEGLQNKIEDIFQEVHESNISKLDEFGKPVINGENGVFDSSRPLGKVLKSKHYREANLKPILCGL